jgi:8-oxo-dGTP diphosphatase
MAQRPPGKAMAGLWEFPGGKKEDGETLEACLARELDEEIGITVSPADLTPLTFASHTYAGDSGLYLVMPLYEVAGDWGGRVGAVGREGQALKWVAAADLAREPMPAADAPLLPAVAAAAARRAVPSVADAT